MADYTPGLCTCALSAKMSTHLSFIRCGNMGLKQYDSTVLHYVDSATVQNVRNFLITLPKPRFVNSAEVQLNCPSLGLQSGYSYKFKKRWIQ